MKIVIGSMPSVGREFARRRELRVAELSGASRSQVSIGVGLVVLCLVGILAPVSASAEEAAAELDASPEVETRAVELRDEPSAAARFRWYNERLVYNLEIFNARVARAAIQVGPRAQVAEHGLVVPIQSAATSHGMLDAVYAIRNEAITYLDPETLMPLWSEKILDEKGERREYQVTYVGDEYRARTRRIRRGAEHWFRRFVPSDTHDAFSWVFDLRSRDLRVGDRYYYYIYDGWKLSRLIAHVTEHEPYITEEDSWDAARISITREVLSSHAYLPWAEPVAALPPVYTIEEGPYEVGVGWISLDDARIPLGLEIAVGALGRLRLTIEQYHPPH